MKGIHENRIRRLNNEDIIYEKGPVVYWMNRDGRVHDNWALLYAQERARELKVPLVVMYNLEIGFGGGGLRQHDFKVRGIREVSEDLRKLNIPFYLLIHQKKNKDEKGQGKEMHDWLDSIDAGLLVTDFFPLRHPRAWADYLRKNIEIPMYGVDAHNIVPTWVTSDKQEFAARTMRPKLHRLLPEYLTNFPKMRKMKPDNMSAIDNQDINWEDLLTGQKFSYDVSTVDWINPGYTAGMSQLKVFIQKRFDVYADERNNGLVRGQSDLSPYLHYGQIAPQRVAWQVVQHVDVPIEKILSADRNGAASKNSAAAFLEELIIRRELSDNYCFYNSDYDNTKGFHEWAQKTLNEHANDKREYIYTFKAFEDARTHDELWNAAQREMVTTGKMHGYMRMYWAKKILQWSRSIEEAYQTAITLNDRYSLDGRDPNGFVGVAWSIGGVHDRAWFERDVFGKIRYMAESGVQKRFSVKEYIAKFPPEENDEK